MQALQYLNSLKDKFTYEEVIEAKAVIHDLNYAIERLESLYNSLGVQENVKLVELKQKVLEVERELVDYFEM